MGSIETSLINMFNKHRIVFWKDQDEKVREEYESVNINGIIKLEIDNNEFGLKHKILKEEPETKFLLYRAGPNPVDEENWLLDIELSSGELRTDQSSIWLSELDISYDYIEIVEKYSDFFRLKKRREALKKRLTGSEKANEFIFKILASCCDKLVDPRIDSIIESLFEECSKGENNRITLIKECGLETFLFDEIGLFFNYKSEVLSVEDFGIELFKSCLKIEVKDPNSKPLLNQEALIFMHRWMDSSSQRDSFEFFSKLSSNGLKEKLYGMNIESYIHIDFFEVVDQVVINRITDALKNKTISYDKSLELLRSRNNTFWYKKYKSMYKALTYIGKFLQLLPTINLDFKTLEDGIRNYSSNWYKVDQLYRKVIYYNNRARKELNVDLSYLIDYIEGHYDNSYLLKLGNSWQEKLNDNNKWHYDGVTKQNRFYSNYVSKFITSKKKVVVIISDAMRYEIGQELWGKVIRENRYDATIDHQISMLPSYTQLGMAALLPNNNDIKIVDNGRVIIDGMNTSGTENRDKIIKKQLSGEGAAISADDFRNLDRQASREFVKNNKVIYIYHDLIDDAGHSSSRVFDAANDTISDLLSLINHLTNKSNVNNIIVTSDHGFIYQNRSLDDSDYIGVPVDKENVLYSDRRFLIGNNLPDNPSLTKYSSNDVGLMGELEIQIPKSINRIRKQGGGSQFVHGGSSLQEIIVPVVTINKKRADDISKVEVQILGSGSSIITTRQLGVELYQEQAVGGKNKPREVRLTLYSENGTAISSSEKIVFDSISNEARERSYLTKVVLNNSADSFSGQKVYLKLEEREGNTSHFNDYRTVTYTLNLNAAFGSDFDEWG